MGREPRYEDHFQRGTVLRLFWEGMYGIRQTYQVLRYLLGYTAHYVNVGYWPQGLATIEPGRHLALLHGEALGLRPGDRLLDCGSGLGQAAVDLTLRFELESVVGLNPSVPQVSFARRLVEAHHLSDAIRFVEQDACHAVDRLAPGSFHAAMAVECFSYFKDKRRFLLGLRRALVPGGRFAFADVCSAEHLSRRRRGALGLVSHAESRPVSDLAGLLESCGFELLSHRDITPAVVPVALSHARQRLELDPLALRRLGPGIDAVVRAYLDTCDRLFAGGGSTYDLLVARSR